MKELVVRVSAEVLQSNYEEYRKSVIEHIDKIDTKTDLITDQEFKAAKDVIKDCKEEETKIDIIHQKILSGTGDLNTVLSGLVDLKGTIAKRRSDLNKKVVADQEKANRAITDGGRAAVAEFLNEQDEIVKKVTTIDYSLIDDAIKRKQSSETKQIAVDNAAAGIIATIQKTAELVESNTKKFNELAEGYESSFPDRTSLLVAPETELIATVKGRVAEAKLEEKERKEREEAEAKRKAEKEKADREADAKKVAEAQASQPVIVAPPVEAGNVQSPVEHPPLETERAGGVNSYSYTGTAVTRPQPIESVDHVQEPTDRYVMTVYINGTKEQAESIAKAIHESVLTTYGDLVESVNLDPVEVEVAV